MHGTAQLPVVVHWPGGPGVPAEGAPCPCPPALPEFVLPAVTRSASLLGALLDDSALDVELAGSVLALDPGLAFGTLQLANRERRREPVWELPLALVAAGRDELQYLVYRTPQIQSFPDVTRRSCLQLLVLNAALRACAAHFLAQKLGSCPPRKAFLAGLLLELPALMTLGLSQPPGCRAKLLSAMCRSLPAPMVTAAMARTDRAGDEPRDPLLALVLIADQLLQARNGAAASSGMREELAARPLWSCWRETGARRRSALLGACEALLGWASANLYRMQPWEFVQALEQARSWE
ncbi:MAG TPA: HDOD domain-containing protein [Candidatus Binatia bacterium]|nr:HDOD domain-containing protein [Candidatus Binatia bacterium]